MKQLQSQRSDRWINFAPLKWVTLFLLFVLACPPLAAEKQVEPKDKDEALQWFRKSYEMAGGKDIQINLQTGILSYVGRDKQRSEYNLATLVSTSLARDAQSGEWRVSFYSYQFGELWWQSRERWQAERFQAALRFLALEAQRNIDAAISDELQRFQKVASGWRALAVKPAISEDAYPHKVLAEEAYKNKDLNKAFLEYSLALMKFPTWPEGLFNAALIGGELKRYRAAVMRMNEYLLLVPDATDAQAAKDKMIIWQDLTTRPAATVTR